MKKRLMMAGICMMSLSAVHAQQDTTLNRTVIVENEYNPTVMDASKINVLPKVNEPKVAKKNIDYATSLRPVSSWNYQTMSPVIREWETDRPSRGYLRAGYGNNGNVDVKVGYLWDLTQQDRLNVAASLDGWNGDLQNEDKELGDWTSRLYHAKIGMDYKHSFRKVDMTLGGSFRSQVFNYMPFASFPSLTEREEGTTRQHQILGNGYIGFVSTDEEMPVRFAAEMGTHYFKMKYATMYQDAGNETNFYLKGDVWKMVSDASRYGLGVKFDNYAYSTETDGAMALDLNPYYAMEKGGWRIRLGVNVDWWHGDYPWWNDDKKKLYVSPDVSLEYQFSNSYMLQAKAGGGRRTHSFYQLTTGYSPYWMTDGLLPTYATLDAELGLKGSPVNGLWFGVAGGYRVTEHDFVPGLTADDVAYFSAVSECKSKVAHARAEVKYDYKDVWGVYLKGAYFDWELEKAESCGLLPEAELNLGIHVRVLEGLNLDLGYDYVKRADADGYDPVSNLHIGADYVLLKNLSLFGKVNNLLNKEYVRADAYPAQKLNFLAGLSLQF